jgi:CRP-like cAMP-binding protein
VSEGEHATNCCLCIDGFVYRAKNTSYGGCQILSVHIPGDMPDLQSLYLHRMDHDLIAMTRCTAGFVPHAALRQLVRRRANVAEVLWRDTLIDAAICREWMVNLGQRDTLNRLAHFVLEMQRRLDAVAMTNGGSFRWPIVQHQMAEALGITVVHVNRVLKDLRERGLMEVHGGMLTILDQAGLVVAGEFDAAYLHDEQLH